jgi:hypothetical protein
MTQHQLPYACHKTQWLHPYQLSIVLMIIGLLVGGIRVGRTLPEAAKFTA